MDCIKSHLKKAEGSQEKRVTATGSVPAGLFGGDPCPVSTRVTSAEPDGQASTSRLLRTGSLLILIWLPGRPCPYQCKNIKSSGSGNNKLVHGIPVTQPVPGHGN